LICIIDCRRTARDDGTNALLWGQMQRVPGRVGLLFAATLGKLYPAQFELGATRFDPRDIPALLKLQWNHMRIAGSAEVCMFDSSQ
jgi:hypothetical protein